MKRLKSGICGVLLTSVSNLFASTGVGPNIILINIDDLGWTDLSCNGSKYYETPHIDQLRQSGIWFSQAYAGAANSAPSRACMLTGQYSPRHGIYTVNQSERGNAKDRKLIPIPNQTALPEGYQTLPQVLHDAGYQTFHVGKWHITSDPTDCGFDINVAGNQAGNPRTYFAPYQNPDLQDGVEGEFLTDRLGKEAAGLIENADHTRPFFLYYAPYAVHTPLEAEAELIEKYKAKPSTKAHHHPVYAALVEAMDRNVGRILQTVRDQGLEDNTLILFTSDNGGVYHISKQWPLRAGKGSFYEGGIRVPLIVYWKGLFEQKEIDHTSVLQMDLFPTLLDIIGISSDTLLLDGRSLKRLLQEGTDHELKERSLYWHFPAYLEGGNKETTDTVFRTRPVSVIRKGEWKLIENYETETYELYRISNDRSESEDLAAKHPETVQMLSDSLNKWKIAVKAPVPNGRNPKYQED